MFSNKRTVRVEWGDCDAAGIVFYPRYFAFFDASTQHLFEEAGFKKQDMGKQFNAVGYPMVDTRAKFIVPSSYGQDIEIRSTISEFRKSSFDVKHEVYKGDVLAIEAWETRVWVGKNPDDDKKLKSMPIPQEILERFQRG